MHPPPPSPPPQEIFGILDPLRSLLVHFNIDHAGGAEYTCHYQSVHPCRSSVERSFSQMKLIKTRLRSCLRESSLSHLMKIAIESPDKLSDSDLEDIVDTWNRKSRRIAV